jgi:tetratricopeptide (TPR) repeat protein
MKNNILKKTFFRFNVFFFLFLLISCSSILAQESLSNKEEKKLYEYLHNGFNFFVQNKTKEALHEYKKALKIDPNNHNAYYNSGLLYAKTKQFDEAISTVNKALLNCKEDLGSFYRLKANCFSDMGRYTEALPLFFKDLEGGSKDSLNVNYNVGYTYFMLKDYKNALFYLNKFIERKPLNDRQYKEAYFYVGNCYMELKDCRNAIQYYDLALADNKLFRCYYNKAEALSQLKRNEEAIATITEGINNNPDKEILYHKRYQIYRDIKEKEKSFEDLKKAYSINPNEPDVLFDMGTYYSEDNRMDDAIKCYHRCISLNENLIGSYNNLANIYSDNKLRSDSAEFYHKKAIDLAPDTGSSYYNFANYYRNIDQYDQAIALYKIAIEKTPDLSIAYTNMGIAYSLKKDIGQAIKCVEKAVEISPEDSGNYGLLASLYFDKLDYKNTIVFATKALRLSKKNVSTNEVLRLRAVSRQILGDYKNALYDYLEIFSSYDLTQKNKASDILSNIGYCYLEDDELQNSLKYFNEAVASSPEIDQLIGLFTVQYLLQDKIGYRKTLAQAIEVEPKLKQGYKGVEKLEEDGYFYTEKHKKVLKKILAQ